MIIKILNYQFLAIRNLLNFIPVDELSKNQEIFNFIKFNILKSKI